MTRERTIVHTRTMTRRLSLLAAVTLAAAACGGEAAPANEAPVAASATEAAPTTEAPSTTTTSAPTTTTTQPAPTTTVAVTTTIPLGQLPLVFESVGEVSGDGQALAPGEYRTDSLSHEMRHQIANEVSVRQWNFTYGIAQPEFDVSGDAAVFFFDSSGLPVVENIGLHHPPPDQELKQILSPAYLDEFFAETPGLVLIDSGRTSDGLSSWWEFTVEADAPQSFDHCNFGSRCVNIIWVDGCSCYFLAGEDWTFRLWRLVHGDAGVYAWFQAPNEIYDEWRAFGEEIVEGTTVQH